MVARRDVAAAVAVLDDPQTSDVQAEVQRDESMARLMVGRADKAAAGLGHAGNSTTIATSIHALYKRIDPRHGAAADGAPKNDPKTPPPLSRGQRILLKEPNLSGTPNVLRIPMKRTANGLPSSLLEHRGRLCEHAHLNTNGGITTLGQQRSTLTNKVRSRLSIQKSTSKSMRRTI